MPQTNFNSSDGH